MDHFVVLTEGKLTLTFQVINLVTSARDRNVYLWLWMEMIVAQRQLASVGTFGVMKLSSQFANLQIKHNTDSQPGDCRLQGFVYEWWVTSICGSRYNKPRQVPCITTFPRKTNKQVMNERDKQNVAFPSYAIANYCSLSYYHFCMLYSLSPLIVQTAWKWYQLLLQCA